MLIFQFLNNRIHNDVLFDMIVDFIIQKLKNKHTFLKNIQTEKAEEPLISTEREKTKTIYFPPKYEDSKGEIHDREMREQYRKRMENFRTRKMQKLLSNEGM